MKFRFIEYGEKNAKEALFLPYHPMTIVLEMAKILGVLRRGCIIWFDFRIRI